jgi:hypothetical protein
MSKGEHTEYLSALYNYFMIFMQRMLNWNKTVYQTIFRLDCSNQYFLDTRMK